MKPTRNTDSAPGDWYVDTACIDCGASRHVAPGLIVARQGKSVFAHQPTTQRSHRGVAQALQRRASAPELELLDPDRIQAAPSIPTHPSTPSRFPGINRSKFRRQVRSGCRILSPQSSLWRSPETGA